MAFDQRFVRRFRHLTWGLFDPRWPSQSVTLQDCGARRGRGRASQALRPTKCCTARNLPLAREKVVQPVLVALFGIPLSSDWRSQFECINIDRSPLIGC